MRIIQCLTALIEEELADAKKYTELALKYEADQPDTAKLFRDLSDEEMRHMERLHKASEALIADHRRTKGEPPAEMLAVYRFLHERQIAAAKEVKVLQGLYDGH